MTPRTSPKFIASLGTRDSDSEKKLLGRPLYPLGRLLYPLGRPLYPLGRPLYPLGRPLYPLGRPLYPLGRPLYPLGSYAYFTLLANASGCRSPLWSREGSSVPTHSAWKRFLPP